MALENELPLIEAGRQLNLISEKPIATRNKVEMDGVAAAWLLFQFSRQSKEQKASHTIRTLLPSGELKVVNIEVECLMTKKSGDGRKIPVGLPGAFAQDIFIALMDLLVNQIKSTHHELIAKAQTVGLKGVPLPPSCTEVYFRNKDLAHTMSMVEKNARITAALEHLHKTHITIRGCIYRNGKEEVVQHDTYYIPSLTAGKRIRGGMDKTEWHRAKFDDVLVKEILHGYIAQMDTEKLLRLPSGAPRKLYSLLAAKILERKGEKTILITNDEIINTLRIKKSVYQKLAKRYFQDLIDAFIISGYSFSAHNGVDVVSFELPPDDHQLTGAPSASKIASEFFAMAEEVGRREQSLLATIKNPRACDLDASNLAMILRQSRGEVEFKGKFYPKAVLWADMLIYNRARGQMIKSIVAVLRSRLKKDEEPIPMNGFEPMDLRYKKIQAKAEAQKFVEKTQEKTRLEDAVVRKKAEDTWENYSGAQKHKITETIGDVIFKSNNLGWQPQSNFLEFRAIDMLVEAINQGRSINDVADLLKWYRREHGNGNSNSSAE